MKAIEHGGANGSSEYFGLKRTNDPGLYITCTKDEDNQFQNMCWVDSCSETGYAYFLDVIAIDTTYKNKRYNLSLLTFAFAILSYEKHDSFVWALNELA